LELVRASSFIILHSAVAFLQAGAKAQCNVIVHVLDRNDNAPRFTQPVYRGSVSEAAAIGSLVLTNTSTPLVITARDQDSELNALLSYDIIETLPRKFFHIDSSTGKLFDKGFIFYGRKVGGITSFL
jgi:protocadherin Fat 1/2/3